MRYEKANVLRYFRLPLVIIIIAGTVMNFISCNSTENKDNCFKQAYTTDIDELSVYDYEKFYRSGISVRHTVMKESSSALISLYNYNKVFPVELVKPIDADRIFVVYKLERDDMLQTLVYMVFKRTNYDFTDSSNIDNENYLKLWETTGEFYFVANKNSISAYSDIDIGTSALEVEKIDSSVSFDCKYIKLPTTSVCFTSYRILTDGILLIEFEAPIDNETNEIPSFTEFIVKTKTFYPYVENVSPNNITIMGYSNLIL